MRCLVIILFTCIWAVASGAQDDKYSWFAVPQNVGAIALFWDNGNAEKTFEVKDGKGKLLDSGVWKPSTPLVKQYRVSPGTYKISTSGEQPIEIDVLAGEITPIRIGPKGEMLVDPALLHFDLLRYYESAEKAGQKISPPKPIRPDEKILELKAWPGVRPPPEQ